MGGIELNTEYYVNLIHEIRKQQAFERGYSLSNKVLATSLLQSKHFNVILFQVIVPLRTKNVRNVGFSLLNPHLLRSTLLLVPQKIVNILKYSLKIPESIDENKRHFEYHPVSHVSELRNRSFEPKGEKNYMSKSYGRKSHFQNGRKKDL